MAAFTTPSSGAGLWVGLLHSFQSWGLKFATVNPVLCLRSIVVLGCQNIAELHMCLMTSEIEEVRSNAARDEHEIH